MAITRTESDIDYAKIKGLADDTVLDVVVEHWAAVTDTLTTIYGDSAVIRYGQEITTLGISGWYCSDVDLQYLGSNNNSSSWIQNLQISRKKPTLTTQDQPDPLLRSVRRVRATIEFSDQPSIIDYQGRPVVNRAGDWMSGFSLRVPVTSWHYEWNAAALPHWLLTANGSINSASFTVGGLTIPPYCAMLVCDEYPLPDNIKTENGTSHYPLFWRIVIDPRGHLEHKLNQGLLERCYVDINGNTVSPTATPGSGAGQLYRTVKKAILDGNGEPITTPGFLDWYGRAIKDIAPTNTPVGNCATTLGSATITLASGSFAADDLGKFVAIKAPGRGAGFYSTIESIAGAAATLVGAVPFTAAAATLYKPGVSTLSFLPAPIVDWAAAAGIPL